MAARPLPPLPLMVAPKQTATSLDDINDVMLPPDTSSKCSYMAPHKLFALDYYQYNGIPPIVMDDPPNNIKGGRGNGAVPSPLRKKKPPALSPT